jgi:magnesium transporter
MQESTPVAEPSLAADLQEAWSLLDWEERLSGFMTLDRSAADDFFLGLPTRDQAGLLMALPIAQARSWLRLLAPDDAADVIQLIPRDQREEYLAVLDVPTQREVRGLLAYAEDEAGGLMNPRYARLRPEMSVDEAIAYLRKQAREKAETITYGYALDESERLVGVVSFRQLMAATPSQRIADIMVSELVTAQPEMDQEEVSRLFGKHHLMAIPVVDEERHMRGVITIDDIVDVVREEATEDIQKIGGMQALEEPYLEIGLRTMIRKRAPWLAVLLLGEMFTATAMGYYETELARAVVLALFVPLVISSGGNSGSQATTLIIRAMALGEVRLRDWFRVVRREFFSGLGLGLVLGVIGVLRILGWEMIFHTYGAHANELAIIVGVSLVGVVLWGTLAGSMLPFLLRRLGADPASASAPFVATVVDVTGLVIYFTMAQLVMKSEGPL